MGYWLKRFADNTQVRGSDRAVSIGAASWSRSRFDDMIEAELEHHGRILRITGPGQFWQSDTYEAVFPGPQTKLISRRIARLIEPSDTHFRYAVGESLGHVVFNDQNLTEGGLFQAISAAHRGKWLVLEYNAEQRKIRHYIRSGRP